MVVHMTKLSAFLLVVSHAGQLFAAGDRMPGRAVLRTPRFVVLLALALLLTWAVPAEAGLPVRAALMMNMSTGHILYEKNADKQIPPASLTKIMTSFLVHDAISAGRLSMRTRVRVPAQATRVGGSSMHLRKGELVTVEDLLKGAIVASGNDAATALALSTSGRLQTFVGAMNAKAQQIGMKRTRFKTVTGLPAAGQLTTARDMARLCRAYLNRHPKAIRFHSTRSFTHRNRELGTTNPFLGSKGVNGLKTGFTLSSGYNIILTTGRARHNLLIVVLGGKSKERRDSAAYSLLTAGLNHPNNSAMVQQIIDGRQKRQLSTKKQGRNARKAQPVPKKKQVQKKKGQKKKNALMQQPRKKQKAQQQTKAQKKKNTRK